MLGKKISNSSSAKGRSGAVTAAEPSTSGPKNLTKANSVSSLSPFNPTTMAASTSESQANFSTHIKISENGKMLPHYSAALGRPHDESLPAEELDAIQMELELLLSTVVLRMRSLRTDFESLDREDKKHKKGTEKQPSSPSTSGTKRKRIEGNKKTNKDAKQFPGATLKQTKLKTSSAQSPAHSQHTDDSMDAVPYYQSQASGRPEQSSSKLLIPKNDVPNKFWLSVEPYCMPITQEDIKLLDDLIEEYSGPIVPPVPELGPHYTSQWTAEDLRDEQDNSNQNAKANKRFTNAATSDVISMMKKCDKLIGEGITGPLTQRLVSALLEENLTSSDVSNPSDGAMVNGAGENGAENNSSTANRLTPITSLLKSGIDVEKRLKKELVDLGILDSNDLAKDKEDEVLNEIIRVRNELYAISEYNLNELKSLREAALEEMKRLEIKRKLDFVDQELIESYKKVWAAKQKRRPLTKQERADIYRLSEEQKNLAAQLEAIPMPGFKRYMAPKFSTEKKVI